MTDDTCATLLLCAFQGGEQEYLPLNVDEYNRVAFILHRSGQRPGDLLEGVSISDISLETAISQDRIEWLLDRRINLGFTLEQWYRSGIWVLSRSDPNYPMDLRKNMGNHSPPLIFGVGNQHLHRQEALAIVGPDSIPPSRIIKAGELVKDFIVQQRTVITIGQLKMGNLVVQNVYDHAGKVIWVLWGGHLKQRLQKPYRQAIRDGCLTMITMQSPNTPSTSREEAVVAQVATALAEEILYVDGSNLKDVTKKTDRYQVLKSAFKRSSQCRVLHGRTLSPEGQELLKAGASSWSNKNMQGDKKSSDHQSISHTRPSKGDHSSYQGDLFGEA